MYPQKGEPLGESPRALLKFGMHVRELFHDLCVSRVVDVVEWTVVDAEAVAPDVQRAMGEGKRSRCVGPRVFDDLGFLTFAAEGDAAAREVGVAWCGIVAAGPRDVIASALEELVH